VSLRFTSPEQLEHVSPRVRAQLEVELKRCCDMAHPIEVPRLPGEATAKAPRRGQPEQEVGRMLVDWIDLVTLPNGIKPGLYFYHVANAGVAEGKVRGGILQGQGVRKGWPDYGLDLPLGGYHGFRLEIKRLDGDKPTAEQLEILARLEAVGFKCAVAWGFDDAKRQTELYLDLAGRA
jgi:hypothetical protein